MRPALRRASRLASYGLTAFLIGVAVFALAEYATGTQPFYVVSDSPSSMSPTVNFGDVAVIYKAPYASVAAGTIIAFRDPRGNPVVVLHRVVAVRACGADVCLATKGDNNATNPDRDPWNVTQSDYIGEAVLIAPHLGYVSPELWGFSGAAVLLPLSTVALAIAVADQLRKGREQEEGAR